MLKLNGKLKMTHVLIPQTNGLTCQRADSITQTNVITFIILDFLNKSYVYIGKNAVTKNKSADYIIQ